MLIIIITKARANFIFTKKYVVFTVCHAIYLMLGMLCHCKYLNFEKYANVKNNNNIT